MTPDEPTLRYESSVAGALMPGERVLWEDHPHPPEPKQPRRQPYLAVAAFVMIPLATAIITAVGTHNAATTTISTIVVGVLTLVALISSTGKERSGRKDLDHTLYRITDRRIIRSDDRPGKPLWQTEIAAMGRIVTVHGRRPEITIDGVQFSDVPDANGVLLRVLYLWARSGRRKKFRRSGRSPMSIPPTSDLVNPADVPTGIVLAADETVLWIGRPRMRDPIDGEWVLSRFKLIAWLCVPVALLLSAFGIPEWAPHVHWAFGVIAAFWLVMATYTLTLEPFAERRRRARQVYLLTNIRTINHETGNKPMTRSQLLDMVSGVNITGRRSSGAADVLIGSAMFNHLPEAQAERLADLALDAVRAAGTTITPLDSATSPDPDLD